MRDAGKWEYNFLHVYDFNQSHEDQARTMETELNALGEQGWELVSVAEGRGFSAFLKRPKH